MPEQFMQIPDDMIFRAVFLNPHKKESKVSIGIGVDMDFTARIDMSGDVTIADNVYISQGVMIYTHDHKMKRGQSVHEGELKIGGIVIGKNAWIGARAMILEQCHKIGEGAIIGAGAVITHDVGDYEIIAGNPGMKVGEVQPT